MNKTQRKWKTIKKEFKRDWQLDTLMLLPLIYLIIFDFIPMYGVQIAFRDYRPLHGIIGSEWVGLKWFKDFLSNYKFREIFTNTVMLSIYSIATFPLAIIFALILHAMRSEKYKKVVQTVAYIPHFISVTVMVGIITMLFSPVSGIYGNIFRLFGGTGYPEDLERLQRLFGICIYGRGYGSRLVGTLLFILRHFLPCLRNFMKQHRLTVHQDLNACGILTFRPFYRRLQFSSF